MANQLRNLLNIPCVVQFYPFCWQSLFYSIHVLVDEKYFVYRSIIPNYKKNNGIKGSTTLMKVTGEQSTVSSFLGFSRNVSGQKLLVYYILILINGVPTSTLKGERTLKFWIRLLDYTVVEALSPKKCKCTLLEVWLLYILGYISFL